MMTFFTKTSEETEALGAGLAAAFERKGIRRGFVALFGEMGVGKTAFTRGFAIQLGCKSVKSPTYTVVNEYHTGRVPIYHFDMYRIEGEDDLLSIGFEDYLEREGFSLCEWSENIIDALPSGAVRILLERTDDSEGRKITISNAEELEIC